MTATTELLPALVEDAILTDAEYLDTEIIPLPPRRPTLPPSYTTREDWLTAFIPVARPFFARYGHPLPERIRVSCGFAYCSRTAIGQIWSDAASTDKTFEIFISPKLDNPVDVIAVFLHELVHAAVGIEAKHGKKFRNLALAIGLTGKMTATLPGPELVERIKEFYPIVLGKYPHSQMIDFSQRKKQTTRLIGFTCPECGMKIRLTRTYIEKPGAPFCACSLKRFIPDTSE